MVESSALLKRRTPKGYRGFESLPHRSPRMTLNQSKTHNHPHNHRRWNKRRISHRTHVWIDFVLGITGLVLAAIGWLFQYAEQIPWFEKIAAPQYVAAMNCYDQMIKSHKPVSRGAPGFAEIEMQLHEKETGPTPHPQFTTITIPKDNVAIFGEPAGTGVVIDVIAQPWPPATAGSSPNRDDGMSELLRISTDENKKEARGRWISRLFSEAKCADVAQLVEQLIRNSREGLCVGFRDVAQSVLRGGS